MRKKKGGVSCETPPSSQRKRVDPYSWISTVLSSLERVTIVTNELPI